MFCSKCGTKLDDNARFCPKCGEPVDAPSQASFQEPAGNQPIAPVSKVTKENTQSGSQPKNDQPQTNPSKSLKSDPKIKIFIGTGIAAAIAVVAIIAFVLAKGSTVGNNTANGNNGISLFDNRSKAMLLEGKEFNSAIHALAGEQLDFLNGDVTSSDSSRSIESIQFLAGENLADYDLSDGTVVSTEDSSHPAYAFYDSDIETVTVITEADIFCANSNSMKMFFGFYNLTSLDISSLDTSNVTDMSFMFESCKSLTSLDLSSFNTSNVTTMTFMFDECYSLTSLDLSSFNTSNVADISYFFNDCSSLTSPDLSSFDTGNVIDMSSMFSGCENLTTLDLSNFDTSNVSYMAYLFDECYSLTSPDLSSFYTGNVLDMAGMFGECESLTTLDLSNFDTYSVTDMSYMFYACDNLQTIYVSDLFTVDNVTDGDDVFFRAYNIVGGAGTTYNSDCYDVQYAHIDEGSTNPGYFTAK